MRYFASFLFAFIMFWLFLCRLFAENIVMQDPDVITLQEVRIDASFFSALGKIVYCDTSGNYSKFDGGNQPLSLVESWYLGS
jgi:hypothetical protein